MLNINLPKSNTDSRGGSEGGKDMKGEETPRPRPVTMIRYDTPRGDTVRHDTIRRANSLPSIAVTGGYLDHEGTSSCRTQKAETPDFHLLGKEARKSWHLRKERVERALSWITRELVNICIS